MIVQVCMNAECAECGEPSVQVVDYGCVHEHLATDVTVCHRCWVELMRLAARDRFVCKVCYDDHLCPMRVIRNESLGLREGTS